MSAHLASASKPAAANDGGEATPTQDNGVADRIEPALIDRYLAVRERSLTLAAPLSAEDAMLQSMPDASPAKWHLAHTSWFFEQFVLATQPNYRAIDDDWTYLFNSYYDSVGARHARPQRGLLSRPSLQQVLQHRDEVDARMATALPELSETLQRVVVMGLQHEQQHQELLLTDIKHGLWCNPLRPAYRDDLTIPQASEATPLDWIGGDEGIVEIGAPPWPQHDDFAYDNESPRHRVLLHPHALASRPVNNAEYREFIDDGGYRNAGLWLSDGWARVQAESWARPLYWDEDDECEFTLGGMREIDAHAPVCHLSHYEADAFARWAGARLPTEFEWEHAAAQMPVQGNFVENDILHPASSSSLRSCRSDVSRDPKTPRNDIQVAALAAPAKAHTPQRMFGNVWEWTSSAYAGYPGFRPLPDALGEYNGKFMCDQQVLRGGSCASARDHLRASYRNFFHSPDRWQFSGLRLAKDLP